MQEDYEKGLALLRAGEYFAAHEALEAAWRAGPAWERDFFQGLVHVVVAWYQAGRGRRIGCERQLDKAERRLAPYAPAPRGGAVPPLPQGVPAPRAQVRAGPLRLTQPDGLQGPPRPRPRPP